MKKGRKESRERRLASRPGHTDLLGSTPLEFATSPVVGNGHELGPAAVYREHFRRIFEESPLGLAIIGFDYRFIKVNERLCHMLGYSSEKLKTKTFVDITHPDDIDKDIELTHQLERGEIERFSLEKRYIRQDGTVFWISLNSCLLHDDKGKPMCHLSIVEDISARKHAEDEILRSENLLRMTGEMTHIGGWEIVLPSREVRWSAELFRLHEWPSGQAPGLDECLRFFPGEAHAAVSRVFRKCVARGASFDLQLPFVTANNRRLWVRIIGRAIRNNGRTERIIGVLQDVTAAKEATEKLLRSQQSLDIAIRSAQIGTWDWDVRGNHFSFNDRWAEMLGYSPLEVPPKFEFWAAHLHPEDLPSVMEKWRLHADGRSDFYDVEYRCRTKTGAWVWLITRGRIVERAPDGIPLRAIGTNIDITAAKEAEHRLLRAKEASDRTNRDLQIAIRRANQLAEEARAAEQAKSRFLAVMSHEIRTPLNAILGMTDMLRMSELTIEQQEFAETIRRSGEVLSKLISDILDYSKIEAEKLELERTAINPREIVAETLQMIAERAVSKGLDIGYLVEPDVPAIVEGDGHRLRQVFLNLLSNAVKFTERGSIVVRIAKVSSETHRVALRFSVEDTGVGISPDGLAKLFRSFSQVDGSITRKHGGTGLGLFISKRLVEMMGGDLAVESHPGDGARFHFVLPMQIPSRKGRPKPPYLSGKKALIVSPRKLQLDMVTLIARHLGMEVERASSLRREQLARSDIVFCDESELRKAAASSASAQKAQSPNIIAFAPLNTPLEADAFLKGFPVVRMPCVPAQLDAAALSILKKRARRKPVTKAGRSPGGTQVTVHALKVLLAEDNPVNQRVAALMLKRLGHETHIVGNGVEALEALARAQYDVVLMDLQMPEMDGLTATRTYVEIQRDPRHRAPIIALTANALREDREQCIAAGMLDFLTKPIRIEALEQILSKVAPRTTRSHRTAPA